MFHRLAFPSAAWTCKPDIAKAAAARSMRSRPGAAWPTRTSARSGSKSRNVSTKRARHEAHHLLHRFHLALRVSRIREVAAGARRPELQRRLQARAVRRVSQDARPARAGGNPRQARLDLSASAVDR